MAGADLHAAVLAALKRELERQMRERYEDILGRGPRPGPPPSFKERDFGRWTDKVAEHESSLREEQASSFKEPRRRRPTGAGIFGSRDYQAVASEPGVAVAAAELRAALAEERAAFWRVGDDGMLVYSPAFFEAKVPERLERGEAKLRRRVARALADRPAPEPALW